MLQSSVDSDSTHSDIEEDSDQGQSSLDASEGDGQNAFINGSDPNEDGFVDDPVQLYFSQLPKPMPWEEQLPMLERMCGAQQKWLTEVLGHSFVLSKMTNFFGKHLEGEGKGSIWDQTIGRSAPQGKKKPLLKIIETNMPTLLALQERLHKEIEWGSREAAARTAAKAAELLLECKVSPRIISNLLDELRNAQKEANQTREARDSAEEPAAQKALQEKLLGIRETYGPPDVLNSMLKNVDHQRSIVEEVRRSLSETNLQLIPSAVKKYRRRGQASGMEYLDLIQEGNLEALQKLHRFTMGRARLTTFEISCVKNRMNNLLRSGYDGTRHCMYESEAELAQRMKRRPSTHELEEHVRQKGISTTLPSLFGPNRALSLEGLIEEHRYDVPTQVICEESQEKREMERRTLVERVLGLMENDRERMVLEMRYGLNGYNGQAMTLKEVAKEMGVTKERIRQIEAKAIEKVTPVAVEHGLDNYID